MLDAQPAANAPARPTAIQPLQISPAIADTTGVSSKPAALLAAATALLPNLEAGRALDAKTLREAMSAAFGASDAQGAWVWKDAYEAAEAAMVLFIQRYGRLMRREAGAGPGSAAAMLAMLETLAALEPSQTRRSEEQLALQQFSTPLPFAYAAMQAAAIRPGDIVLEPSAGTGMLAVMAECALGKHASGALHLNEIATTRAGFVNGGAKLVHPGGAKLVHLTDIPHIPSKFVEIVPLSHRQGTVSPLQPSDGMILVIGPRLEGHSVIFLAIQTHLSCRFLLAVDSLGLRRSGSSSQIINQAQDFPEQVPRHRHLSQLERNVAAMSDNLGPVFTSLSRNVVIDQCSTSFGKASVRMKLPRL